MIREVLKKSSRFKFSTANYVSTCCIREKLHSVPIKSWFFALFLITGLVSFTNSTAVAQNICNKVYDGGKIGVGPECVNGVCTEESPEILNKKSPYVGSSHPDADDYEYLWFYSHKDVGGDMNNGTWDMSDFTKINGAKDPYLTEGVFPLKKTGGKTTYILRCSRPKGCTGRMLGEVWTKVVYKGFGLELTATDITCEDFEGGAVKAKAKGPGNLKFVWSTGQETTKWSNGNTVYDQITNLTPGTYSVKVTSTVNYNDCEAEATAEVTGPECCNVTDGGEICCSDTICEKSDFAGVKSLSPASGGYPNEAITYLWMRNDKLDGGDINTWNIVPGENGESLSANAAYLYDETTYFIRCARRENCAELIESDTVCIMIAPLEIAVEVSDILCYGRNSGSACVVIDSETPGTPGYTYEWKNEGGDVVSTDSCANDLAAGKYSVVVTDSKGCEASATFTIEAPAQLTVTVETDSATCEGDLNDGSATATVEGGTPPYTVVWDIDGTTYNGTEVNNLPAGASGTVTVYDRYQCEVSAEVSIPGPEVCCELTASINAGEIQCYGEKADVCAVLENGTAPYTYSWSVKGGSEVSTDSCAAVEGGNTYVLTVVDAKGCEATAEVEVGDAPEELTVEVESRDATCDGNGKDGYAHVTVSGGTGIPGNCIVNLSTNDTTCLLDGIYENLPAGNYVAYAIDANDCKATEEFSIGRPDCCNVTDGGEICCSDTICDKEDFAGVQNVALPSGGYEDDEIQYVWMRNDTLDGGDINTWEMIPGENDESLPANPDYLYNETTYFVRCARRANCAELIESDTVCIMIAPLQITADASNVLCYGDSAEACASISSEYPGTPGYSYAWKDADGNVVSDEKCANLPAGAYTVVVTDAKGCVDSASVEIDQPNDALTAAPDPTNIDCYGAENGSICLRIVGGTEPYNVEWNTGDNGECLRGLAPGVYSAVVTDANNCAIEIPGISINQPEELVVTIGTDSATCEGGLEDGKAWATVTGGTTPYSVEWSTGEVTSDGDTIMNLLAGSTVYATVTDSNGCTAVDSAVVPSPEPCCELTVSYKAGQIDCYGERAEVCAIPENGTAPYTYQWLNAADNSVVATDSCTALEGGKGYILIVVDANDCTDSVEFELDEGPDRLVVEAEGSDVTCDSNGTDGRAWVSAVSGGTAPYTYAWSNDDKDSVAENLMAGAYYVVVTDANGCQDTARVTIGRPACCNVTDGGEICCSDTLCDKNDFAGVHNVALPSGGLESDSIFYIWMRNDTLDGGDINTWTYIPGEHEESLPANPAYLYDNTTYFVRCARRANCNELIESDTVCIMIAPLQITAEASDANCYGDSTGKACAMIDDMYPGTAPYTYVWTNANGDVVSNEECAENLPAGAYQIVVTDAKGCVDSADVEVGQPDVIRITAEADSATCEGDLKDGKICVEVAGGTAPYTYDWSNGDATACIDSLAPGSYSVTVYDANECSASIKVVVGGPESCCELTVSYKAGKINCYGDSAYTCAVPENGTAPYTYQWTMNNTEVGNEKCANLVPGTYMLYVSDAKGCEDSVRVVIGEGPDRLDVSVEKGDATCELTDGYATASATGGTAPYSYKWSNGDMTATADSLEHGQVYTVVVTDANGCIDSAKVEIGRPECCNVTDGGEICCNQEVCTPADLDTIRSAEDASGGVGAAKYLWLRGTTNLPVGHPAADWEPMWSETGEYLVPNGKLLGDTTYFVRCAKREGCDEYPGESNIVRIVILPNLEVAVESSDVLCYGDSSGNACAYVTGGTAPFTYAWYNTDGLVATTDTNCVNLPAGEYKVVVTDAKGCEGEATFEIVEPDPINASIDPTGITCYGANDGSACLRIAGGAEPYRVEWSNGDTTECIDGLAPGTYTATIYDANSCYTTASVEIAEPVELTIDSTKTKNVTCAGANDGEVIVYVSGGTGPYTYYLNGSEVASNHITGLGENVYVIAVVDANGCEVKTKVFIAEPNALEVDAIVLQHTTGCGACDGIAVVSVSGGVAPYTYQWTDEAGSTTDSIGGLCKGVYQVVVTDANGCMASDSVEVQGTDGLSVSTGVKQHETCYEDCDGIAIAVAENASGTPSYSWTLGEDGPEVATTPVASNLCPGTYYVQVSDSVGCTGTGKVVIEGADAPLAIGNDGLEVENSCPDVCNGSVTVIPSGGVAPYTYEWPGHAVNGPTLDSICPGVYNVIVTDKYGCEVSAKTFVEPDQSKCPTGISTLSADEVKFEATPSIFNERTKVAFRLTDASQVTVNVYDLTGNVVGTIYNGNVQAGKDYTVDFDANGLNAGVYIGKLQAGNQVYMTRFVIVR